MYDLYSKRFPCSNCGGKKSLAKYDDGEYCFKCGKDTRHNWKGIKNNRLEYTTQVEKEAFNLYALPSNYVQYLSLIGLDNNLNYEMYYSMYYGERLVIPIFNEEKKVLFLQFKDIYHSDELGKFTPKVISKGNKPFIFFTQLGFKESLDKFKKPLVIVEDPFSAMVVSQVNPTFCLFGNHLNKNLLKQLIKIDNDVILWLDNDEGGREGTADLYEELRPYLNLRVMFTEKDPKYYTETQIREKLKS